MFRRSLMFGLMLATLLTSSAMAQTSGQSLLAKSVYDAAYSSTSLDEYDAAEYQGIAEATKVVAESQLDSALSAMEDAEVPLGTRQSFAAYIGALIASGDGWYDIGSDNYLDGAANENAALTKIAGDLFNPSWQTEHNAGHYGSAITIAEDAEDFILTAKGYYIQALSDFEAAEADYNIAYAEASDWENYTP